ncbi:MAE_28990/MAE_18760 family HEPN-like nuclease [Aquella oligotrophica]|uniref:MAE-28990/MAE-18760-like HEPN domain-containing protein n=1 Tax=Aquella oligotrophica TaxID=2067065 RepID=A0A2I7N4M8_9NEIS|nr:MAE_28990/MAE_18760 family HEPN-like nuclease [Aquella oligotrophica]AUR51417.1 hypothetical protein CUN60_03595 [Aquella oligotrophica]
MNIELLEELLAAESAWRKKEIADLILISEGNDNPPVILKSILLQLYAHWEGLIKRSAKLYLRYIKERNHKFHEVELNFKALVVKNIIAECIKNQNSLHLANEMNIIQKLELENLKYAVGINVDNDQDNSIIDTESNLTPEVLRKILNVIGLTYRQEYEAKSSYLDKNFLHRRHTIAHGSKIENDESFCLDIVTILNLRKLVFSILDIIIDEILEYAINGFYLVDNKDKLEQYLQQQKSRIQAVFSEL